MWKVNSTRWCWTIVTGVKGKLTVVNVKSSRMFVVECLIFLRCRLRWIGKSNNLKVFGSEKTSVFGICLLLFFNPLVFLLSVFAENVVGVIISCKICLRHLTSPWNSILSYICSFRSILNISYVSVSSVTILVARYILGKKSSMCTSLPLQLVYNMLL